MTVEEFYMDEERDETGLVRAACWGFAMRRTCTAMPHSVRAGAALSNGRERASVETPRSRDAMRSQTQMMSSMRQS